MLTKEQINKLIGVEESFHASYKLTEILEDDAKRNDLFDEFLKLESNLNYDWFLNYYQAEHSDRKGLGQDFTPDALAEITSSILGHSESTLDKCAGTGGLTIKRYTDNPNQIFICEEYSDRAIPFLLFNLAIRNLKGEVRHGDSLTRKFKAIYTLKHGEQYSNISRTDNMLESAVYAVISNPPYSQPWVGEKEYLKQERFKDFKQLAPNSKADYAFLLTGLYQLKENGAIAIILPHGVLFRGASEGTIRQRLIEQNYLDTVIGLPNKLFYNTDIPVVILVLKKNRESKDVLFIDASDEFKKDKSKNTLEADHVKKIIETYQSKKETDRFSRIVKLQEMQDNNYNLNIPRYIDKHIAKPVATLSELLIDMKKIDAEIQGTRQSLAKMMNQLTSEKSEVEKELRELVEYFNAKAGDNND